eukprot:m.1665675 g.1665675  ORF g.1665675 m.1665675 type:complete len:51 (+) comp142588_c0_seq1:3-155(+)
MGSSTGHLGIVHVYGSDLCVLIFDCLCVGIAGFVSLLRKLYSASVLFMRN